MNLSELVEISDDPTRKTKKYMTKDGNIIYGPFLDFNNDDRKETNDDEVARLMAELNAMTANKPPPEIDWDQAIQESIEAYSQIPMFDYGTGKMSNQQAMADFYGQAIVNEILDDIEYSYNHRLKDQPPGHISKKL
jgi:hypothetical protein